MDINGGSLDNPELEASTGAVEDVEGADPNTQDYVLAALVRLVNNADGAAIPISLNVGGTVVTGQLIGGRSYFEGIAAVYEPVPGDANNAMRDFFSSFAQIYDKPDDADEDYIGPAPTYIHLKDAHFLTPGNAQMIPGNQGVWWRGRLAAVDGFMMGVMERAEN